MDEEVHNGIGIVRHAWAERISQEEELPHQGFEDQDMAEDSHHLAMEEERFH